MLCTAATANTLDYLPVVVEDCTGSMDGEDRHDAALLCEGRGPALSFIGVSGFFDPLIDVEVEVVAYTPEHT